MIDSNQFLIDFVGDNWMGLVIAYSVFKAAFPNSKILAAIGDTVSGLFPVFKKQ